MSTMKRHGRKYSNGKLSMPENVLVQNLKVSLGELKTFLQELESVAGKFSANQVSSMFPGK